MTLSHYLKNAVPGHSGSAQVDQGFRRSLAQSYTFFKKKMFIKRRAKLLLHLFNCMSEYEPFSFAGFEQGNSKMCNLESASSEDSDQTAHPRSLIRVFTRRSMDSLNPNDSSSG